MKRIFLYLHFPSLFSSFPLLCRLLVSSFSHSASCEQTNDISDKSEGKIKTHYSTLLKQLRKTINASVHLVTVVRPLAARALLGGALLAARVAVLVILEASLTVEGAVDVLSCRLTLAVVL